MTTVSNIKSSSDVSSTASSTDQSLSEIEQQELEEQELEQEEAIAQNGLMTTAQQDAQNFAGALAQIGNSSN